jgi:putative restriction endonuclease
MVPVRRQAFDRGAISISDDQRILISSRLYGQGGADSMFLALSGAQLRTPNRKTATPKADFLGWHRTQVFRGEARDRQSFE